MRRQHRPRYQGIAKIKLLESNLSQMDSVVAQLKKEKDSAKKNIENLRKSIQSACSTIKVCIFFSVSHRNPYTAQAF